MGPGFAPISGSDDAVPSEPSHQMRPRATAGLTIAACALSIALVGCGAELPAFFTAATPPPSAARGATIGSGAVKVGLILPLSAAGQAGTAASSLRNAAELAVGEFQNPNIQILVKDDGGTPEGAREAAEDALAEGAELLLGPLLAPTVQAAAEAARVANRPIVAFSTDASVAERGVYLLSFMPESEVKRVVAYAAGQGRRSFAALVPETPYGLVAEAAFRSVVEARDAQVVAVERYQADGSAMEAAVARLASALSGASPEADALFIPDGGEGLAALSQYLRAAGIGPKVKVIGTGVWNEARVFELPALQGGWFAAPDAAGFNAFATRYRERFGSEPTRIATLGYDGASLIAALARTQGAQRFSETVLTNPAGFNGADGVFRFRQNGVNERGLAVLEIRNGAAVTVSPAPKALTASGT